MDLRIIAINKKGKENEEHVSLIADNDCNLVNFMIADTTYGSSGKESNKLRHVYWFPSQKIKKGDVVLLFTGQGKDIKHDDKNGTGYIFHWGLNEGVWNDDKDTAILFYISDAKATNSGK